MTATTMKITSVKLNNHGLKGIEVKYTLPSTKKNRSFMDEYKATKRAPIHDALENTFSWLKNHLLNICAYTIEEVDRKYLLDNLAITSVKVSSKGFVISGELKILDGTKTLNLETPIVENEIEYPEFNDVVKIIEAIFSETLDYMEGKKSISDVQVVMKFASKEEGYDEELVKKMSPIELRNWATEILEKQGCVVFHGEDMTDVDLDEEVIDVTEVVEHFPPVKMIAHTPVVEEEKIAPAEEIKTFDPHGHLKGQTKIDSNPFNESEGFSLELTPAINKSTAKRKQS